MLRWSRFILMFLFIQHMLITSSFASPEAPQAVTVSWQSTKVSTTEGVSVWLAVVVNGANPSDNVDIDLRYNTQGVTAYTGSDYEGTMGNNFNISGQTRVRLIRIEIYNNNYYENHETFLVQLNSRTNGIDVVGEVKAEVTISRSRQFGGMVGNLQSCLNSSGSANDLPATAGQINPNGGWCDNHFINAPAQASDYYYFIAPKNGRVDIDLLNTTPDQHDYNLYLYVHNGGNEYTFMQQSTNSGQQPEGLSASVSAGARYLIRVYFVSKTGSKDPYYRLKANVP